MQVAKGLLMVLLLAGWPSLMAAAAPQTLPALAPPPPVPPSSKPEPEAASTLVVPIQPDLDLVPKVDPDPQRGLAIRGLLRWHFQQDN